MIAAVQNLCKYYGSTKAIDDISFSIGRGETVAVLGPNGAGKTTTLELLLGLRMPTDGTAHLFGADPRGVEVRRRLGATPQQSSFPETLRACEIAEFVAAQYPNPADVAATLAAFDLESVARRQAGGLSGGQSRRLALALAFIGNPELIVLDEPTTGLDVEARHRFWAYIREYAAGGGTVLLSTHYVEEAESLASRVLVFNRGEIAFDASPQELRTKLGTPRLAYDVDGRHIETTVADTDEAVRALVRNGVDFRNLRVLESSLEDAFLHVTGGSR